MGQDLSAPPFTCIGTGSLGGKATGLTVVREQILPGLDPAEFPGIEVMVPTMSVLASDVFESFMEQGRLYPIALSDRSDLEIAQAFLAAELPAQHLAELGELVTRLRMPLAVRSSSLLEDALEHPFAGVYATKMIPNNQCDPQDRLHQLGQAIKLVYASAFFARAKSYISSVKEDIRAERMAVILQEVVGQNSHDRFYPCLSGVARSFNYYATGHGCPRDGVVSLALGLGRTVVDGGRTWTYSPAWPKSPPPFNDLDALLKNTQTRFWAVDMGQSGNPDPISEAEFLAQPGLAEAESDGALRFLVSTYHPGSDRLYPGLSGSGPRALNFAPILGSGLVPFNDVVKQLLKLAEQALGSAVEVEFAVNLDRRCGRPARLGFLQVRPMMVTHEQVQVSDEEMTGEGVLLASDTGLGNGYHDTIRDVVFLKPEVFEAGSTPRIAMELDSTNRRLVEAGKTYMLIGFGRWGSSDSWLGVPVAWSQISGARVIVEATLPKMSPDLSQGSHFFHNLLSFRIFYISVEHDGPYRIDWDWLNRQQTVNETPFVKHVETARPLHIRVDGGSGRGIVRHSQG